MKKGTAKNSTPGPAEGALTPEEEAIRQEELKRFGDTPTEPDGTDEPATETQAADPGTQAAGETDTNDYERAVFGAKLESITLKGGKARVVLEASVSEVESSGASRMLDERLDVRLLSRQARIPAQSGVEGQTAFPSHEGTADGVVEGELEQAPEPEAEEPEAA